MMTLQATFALAVLCFSVWSALALLLDRRGPARINRRFALVILLFCIPQAYFYTRLLAPARDVLLLSLAAQATIWLKGPLLLSVVRMVVDRPLVSQWRHYLLFPLVLICMALAPQRALEWGLAGFCVLLIYLIVALRDLLRARPRLALIYSAYPNSAWYWLLFVVAGLLLVVSVDLVLMSVAYAQGAFPVGFIQVTSWLVAGYFAVITFFSIYRPQLFFHEDRIEEAGPEPMTTEAAPGWRELDASLGAALAQRLDGLMEHEQLFRQHYLSLAQLAQRLGISQHQASELLNVQLRQTFYGYLNAHRLRHACRLLSDPRCELRVLDIAFEAGFGNKNSFYRAFRDALGVTPVQYRQQALHDSGKRVPAAIMAAQSQNPS